MFNEEKYKNKFDYKTQREEYNKEEGRIHQEFRDDVIEEAGLTGHPKADQVYSKAWEHGHAYGFYEVRSWVLDLAELVK